MKNRIEKSNKTKFDYIARNLGIAGVAIMALTIIIGGSTLISIKEKNQALVRSLAVQTMSIEKGKSFNQGVKYTLDNNGEVEVIIEE